MAEEGENKKNAMVIANGRLICCVIWRWLNCVLGSYFVLLLFCSESLTLAIFNVWFCLRANAVGSWTQTIPTLIALRIGKRKRIDWYEFIWHFHEWQNVNQKNLCSIGIVCDQALVELGHGHGLIIVPRQHCWFAIWPYRNECGPMLINALRISF